MKGRGGKGRGGSSGNRFRGPSSSRPPRFDNRGESTARSERAERSDRSESYDDFDAEEKQDREPENSGSTESNLLIYGRNTVLAYLERMSTDEEDDENQDIIKIFLAEGNAPDDRIRQIKGFAAKFGIPIVNCHKAKLDSMVADSARHQGVVAQVSPVKLLDFGEWLDSFEDEDLTGCILVALDGVEDPRNAGAIIRSAEAQGARAVLIPERRAAGVTETVAKTSAGAIAHIPIVRIVNLVRCLNVLKDRGFWVLGLTAEAREPIYRIDLVRPLVIVVGSEGKGMRPLVEETCDLMAAIPLTGKTSSLNASVALGIAVYETVRQRDSQAKK